MEHENSRLLLVLCQQKIRYAVPAECVEEIITTPEVTTLPVQPEEVKGIFHYQGRVLLVFSLNELSGGSSEAEEPVCVILRTAGRLIALTAEAASSLETDDGQRMNYDDSLMKKALIRLEYVMPGDPPILVLDLEKIGQAIDERINGNPTGADSVLSAGQRRSAESI